MIIREDTGTMDMPIIEYIMSQDIIGIIMGYQTIITTGIHIDKHMTERPAIIILLPINYSTLLVLSSSCDGLPNSAHISLEVLYYNLIFRVFSF